MRRGIFLGTFDPIHIGHLANITYVLNKNLVDIVTVVPTTQNPSKQHSPIASFEDRIQMCTLALRSIIPNVSLSAVEKYLPEKHYTWDVLQELLEIYQDDELILICGDDIDINTWYNGDLILRTFKIIELPRTYINCSSSMIREMLKEDKNCFPYLTNELITFIKTNHLYD